MRTEETARNDQARAPARSPRRASSASESSISIRTRTRKTYRTVNATSDSIRIHTIVGEGWDSARGPTAGGGCSVRHQYEDMYTIGTSKKATMPTIAANR